MTTSEQSDLFTEYGFDETNTERIGSNNLVALNASAEAILTDDEDKLPEIPEKEDNYVKLPGGIWIDGELIVDAEVKELTGEDEEEIAKAMKNGNPVRFVEVLTRQGVVSIGGQKPDRKLLKRLLTGDRDAILLHVARVTFGETHEIEGLVCPGCDEKIDIEFELKEIPIRQAEDPEQKTFNIKLRNGTDAVVRFPIVSDYDRISENRELTTKEQDTILLSQVVQRIGDKEVKNQSAPVRALGIKDRKTILEHIAKTMPGPRYDEITFTHEECGVEVPLPIGVFDLFQDLV